MHTEKSCEIQKSWPRSKTKPILIFSCKERINELSKVSGFLYQNMAGFPKYLTKLIFALSLAKNSGIIRINWHSRLSLCVSSKAYIIAKKETYLKGVFYTLFMPIFWV